MRDAISWFKCKLKPPKMLFMMGHPHLHIKPNLYECKKVQRSEIFKQNGIILISLMFTDLSLPGSGGGGRWMGASGGMGVPPHAWMHAQMHTHIHTCSYPKIYMYRNCKWPPSWVSYLACLTYSCVCMYMHVCEGTPYAHR